MDHSTDASSNAIAAATAAFGLFGLIVGFAFLILMVIVYYRIVAKAGWNGWLSLLLFVPIVNIVMILIFAFSTWPIERRLAYLEHGVPGMAPGMPPPPMPPSIV